MSGPTVIVDTNMIVADLLTRENASPVARILDGMLAAPFPFVVSEALLAKYRTVLGRPGLHKLHGLTVAEVKHFLTELAQHTIVLAPSVVAASAPDARDQLLWELLAVRADLLLVTRDKALLRDACIGDWVILLGDFAGCVRDWSVMQGHCMKPHSDNEVIALPFLMAYSARKLVNEITFDL